MLRYCIALYRDNEQYQFLIDENTDLEENIVSDVAEDDISARENTQNFQENKKSSQRTCPNFNKLRATNPDTVGWIQIPGTAINYPVVHTQDSQKYLDINFNGNKSVCGAIFSCGSTSYNPPSDNITLFGHNLGKNRTKMFSSLVQYKQKDYYQKHDTIYFETLYFKGEYKIFAVFNTNVPGDNFNYTQSSFGSAASRQAFIQTIQNRALYDTGVQIEEDTELLTLSTCDRSFDNETGRLVVVAARQDT